MPARPSGSLHRFVSRGVTGAVVGAVLFFTPHKPGQTSLLAIGQAHAEDTVESPGAPARTGGEAAPKLRPNRLAAKDVKAKDVKAKDANAAVALAPDPTAPLAAELHKPASEAQAVAAVKKLSEL